MMSSAKKCALVVGAGSEPGASIALALANAGYSLVLQDTGGNRMRRPLNRRFRVLKIEVKWIAADITSSEGLKTLCHHARAALPFSLVVICPGHNQLEAATNMLNQLSNVTGAENKETVWIIVMEQVGASGRWSSVSNRNAMIAHFAEVLRRAGVPASTLVTDKDLVAGEIAEAAMNLIAGNPGSFLFEAGRIPRRINAEALTVDPAAVHTSVADKVNINVDEKTGEYMDAGVGMQLAGVVSLVLKTGDLPGITRGGMGITPGWDSLKQIEVILAVEKEFGFRFHAVEIGDIKTFSDLLVKVASHTGERQ